MHRFHQLIQSPLRHTSSSGFLWSTPTTAKMKLVWDAWKLLRGHSIAWVPDQHIDCAMYGMWQVLQTQSMLTMFFSDYLWLGTGIFPHQDPWGKAFDSEYYPSRAALAGQPFSPEGYVGVLEGVQADQDWLRVAFDLAHGPSRQKCCHLCHIVQWVSTKPCDLQNPHNHPNNLYTTFGPDEDRKKLIFWFV